MPPGGERPHVPRKLCRSNDRRNGMGANTDDAEVRPCLQHSICRLNVDECEHAGWLGLNLARFGQIE